MFSALLSDCLIPIDFLIERAHLGRYTFVDGIFWVGVCLVLHQAADALLFFEIDLAIAYRRILTHLRTDFSQHADHHRVVADLVHLALVSRGQPET